MTETGLNLSLIQGAIILLLVLIANFFLKSWLQRLQERFREQGRVWKESFVEALYQPLSAFIWFLAAAFLADIISIHLFGGASFSLVLFIDSAAVLAVGWLLLRWNRLLTARLHTLSRRGKHSANNVKIDLLSKLATLFTIAFTLLMLMDVTGRNMQTLIAFGGIGGLALAFASQQVISNFFGGMMVYFTHPFSIGEWIVINDEQVEGYVENIGWYMTCIRSLDMRPIYVPNSVFAKSIITTPSRMSHQRIKEKIGLTHASKDNLKAIVDEIKAMLSKHPQLDHDQKADAFLKAIGAHSLELEVTAFVSTSTVIPFDSVKEDVLLQVIRIISKNGGDIATAQLPQG